MQEIQTDSKTEKNASNDKFVTGLSLILPCYNENEPIVKENTAYILKILEILQIPFEVIFVDDASLNETNRYIDEVIKQHPDQPLLKITNKKNIGRGGTVMVGIEAAKYPVVGFIDIDLETNIHYLPAFICAINEGKDLVIAKRIYKIQFSFFCITRFILSIGYIGLSHFLLKINYPDTEAGFKIFRRDKFLEIQDQIQDKNWFWDTEIVVRAHNAGWNIHFIPCLFLRRRDKKSSVRVFRDVIAYLKAILKYKRNQG